VLQTETIGHAPFFARPIEQALHAHTLLVRIQPVN
jgi:hypothetical protein